MNFMTSPLYNQWDTLSFCLIQYSSNEAPSFIFLFLFSSSIFLLKCLLPISTSTHPTTSFKNRSRRDFPGGPMVKNPPSNAGDVGSISGQRTKIPRAAGQLNLRATTTELMCLNERAHGPLTMEPMHHDERREKPICHN